MNPTPEPLHVLLVTPAFPPFPGGGERYAHALARNLARQGRRVTVATSTAQRAPDLWQGSPATAVSGADEPHPGVKIVRCGIRPFPGGRMGLLAWRKLMVTLAALPGDQTAVLQRMARRIPAIQGLPDALRALPPGIDLVHGCNISWEYALLAAQAFAQQRGLPFVVTPFTHLGVHSRDRVARNATMDHQRRLLQRADRVHALTPIERRGLLALGLAAERVEVMGAGIDAPPPVAAPEATCARFGLQRPFAIFVGQADVEKGAGHAIEAILHLRRAGIAVSLALVGQISPAIARRLARLTPAEQAGIRPLGVVDEAGKHALLAASDLLLLPSRTDSFGLVLLEAWAHAKPVIGARAGGIPDVIDAEQDGLLVDFGDVAGLAQAVRRLLDDPALRRALGQRGQHKVRRDYTWERVAVRVLASYAALRAHHPSPISPLPRL